MKLISAMRLCMILITIFSPCLLQAQDDDDPLSEWGPIGASAKGGSSDDGSLLVEGHVQFALGEGHTSNYLEVTAGTGETEVDGSGGGAMAGEQLRRLIALQTGVPFDDIDFGSRDVDVTHISVGFRRYFLIRQRTAFYASGAPGVYILDPGDTEFGWRAMAGFEVRLTKRLGLDFSAAYHRVSTPGDDIQYGSFLAGVIYHFGDSD